MNKTKKEAQYIPTEDKDLAYFLKERAFEAFDKQKVKDEASYVFEVLDRIKDKRISKIFRMRYFSGDPKMTWKKIGEKIGVSTQTVINLHEKGKKMVKIKAKNF